MTPARKREILNLNLGPLLRSTSKAVKEKILSLVTDTSTVVDPALKARRIKDNKPPKQNWLPIRCLYEMTDEQRQDALKFWRTGKAAAVWEALGEEFGFDPTTVLPSDRGPHFFTACRR